MEEANISCALNAEGHDDTCAQTCICGDAVHKSRSTFKLNSTSVQHASQTLHTTSLAGKKVLKVPVQGFLGSRPLFAGSGTKEAHLLCWEGLCNERSPHRARCNCREHAWVSPGMLECSSNV